MKKNHRKIMSKLIAISLSLGILSSVSISNHSYALFSKDVNIISGANIGDLDKNEFKVKSINSLDNSKFNIECDNGIVYGFESINSNRNNILLVSNEKMISNNTFEVSREYLDNYSNTIYDVITITRSSNGNDVVTRESRISNFTVISMTAIFDWYTSGAFAYVRCSAMAASYVAHTNLGYSYFNQSKSEGYIALGKAYAQVDYRFYNIQIPVQYQEGTFKITCTDNGTISDNGL